MSVQMLGGTFSHEDFDETTWINETLAQKDDDATLEAHISAVFTKLQILAADLNDDLERGMNEVVNALPRAIGEAERVESLAESLTGDLARVSSRLEAIEGTTSSDVLVLEKLDLIKRNMETCNETLTEAASWSKLVREVHSSFASNSLDKVAAQLEAMQRSERVLRNMPGGAERLKTLQQLKEQLEKVLRPNLLQALKKERAQGLKPYVEMYRKLGQLATLEAEYTAARPEPLHRSWFSFDPLADELLRWLPGWYEEVLSAVGDELRRCGEIFGDGGGGGGARGHGGTPAPAIAARVMVATFEPIKRSFAERTADMFTFPRTEAMYVETLCFVAQALKVLGASRTTSSSSSSLSSKAALSSSLSSSSVAASNEGNDHEGDDEGEGDADGGGGRDADGTGRQNQESGSNDQDLLRMVAAAVGPYVEFQRRYGDLEEEHTWAEFQVILRDLELIGSSSSSSSSSSAAADGSGELATDGIPSGVLEGQPGHQPTIVADTPAAVFSGIVDGVASRSIEAVLRGGGEGGSDGDGGTTDASSSGSSALVSTKGVRGAVRRCLVFTGGSQVAALVRVVSSLLVRFLQHLTNHVIRRKLRTLAGFERKGADGADDAAKKKNRRKKQQRQDETSAPGGTGDDRSNGKGEGGTGPGDGSKKARGGATAGGGGGGGAAAAAEGSEANEASSSAFGASHVSPKNFDMLFLQAALRLLQVAGKWQVAFREFELDTIDYLKALYGLLFPMPSSSANSDGIHAINGGLGPLLPLSSSSSSSSSLPSAASAIMPAFEHLQTSLPGVHGLTGDDEEAATVQHLSLLVAKIALRGSTTTTTTSSSSSSASMAGTTLAKDLKALLLGLVHALGTSSTSTVGGGGAAGGAGGALFPDAMRESLAFAAAARSLVFDLSLQLVRDRLTGMSKLPLWCGKDQPVYSMQPSEHISAVGEHLLSLYQELELFAASDARVDATLVMGDDSVGKLCEADWKKLALLLPLSEAETNSLAALSKGKRPLGMDLAVTDADPLAADDDDDDDDDGDENDDENDENDEEEEEGEEGDGDGLDGPGNAAYAAELKAEERANSRFCSEWLQVSVRSIVALLIREVLEIPRLDDCGAGQLIADLEYFLNVTSALGLPRPALIQHLAALTRLDRDEYSKALLRPKPAVVAAAASSSSDYMSVARNAAKVTQAGGVAGAGVVRKFERHFASIRGIAVVFGEDE